ncbi:MAG: hypothetical protein KAS69_06935 [Planctomycetes bacterium]|nr:hypothetical protein [Planctomycetota bacterium]
MKNENLIAISFTLPNVVLIALATLMLLAAVGYPISAIAAVDKLLIITIIISPAILAIACVFSITALLKKTLKKEAVIATLINAALLAVSLYLYKCFLFELKMMA